VDYGRGQNFIMLFLEACSHFVEDYALGVFLNFRLTASWGPNAAVGAMARCR